MPKTRETVERVPGTELEGAVKTALIDAANVNAVQRPPTNELDFDFGVLSETEEYINALWFGRDGTGKTTDICFMANLDHPGKVLIVNAEGGLKKTALRKRGINTEKIIVWPNPDRPEPITFERLEALHKRLLSDLMEDPKAWIGVGFDSGTEFAQLLREQATDRRRARLLAQQKSFDPTAVDRDDYGVETDQLIRILRRFRDLPCHFAITALEGYNEDPSKGPVGVVPAVNPALRTALLGYVDITLYCRASVYAAGENDNDDALVSYRARTRPTNSTRAKDRFDATPTILAEPTFTRVYGYVTGAIEQDDDPIQAEYRAAKAKEDAAAAPEAKKKTGGGRRAAS